MYATSIVTMNRRVAKNPDHEIQTSPFFIQEAAADTYGTQGCVHDLYM